MKAFSRNTVHTRGSSIPNNRVTMKVIDWHRLCRMKCECGRIMAVVDKTLMCMNSKCDHYEVSYDIPKEMYIELSETLNKVA